MKDRSQEQKINEKPDKSSQKNETVHQKAIKLMKKKS